MLKTGQTCFNGAEHDKNSRLRGPAHLPEVRDRVFDTVIVRLLLGRVGGRMHRPHRRDVPALGSG